MIDPANLCQVRHFYKSDVHKLHEFTTQISFCGKQPKQKDLNICYFNRVFQIFLLLCQGAEYFKTSRVLLAVSNGFVTLLKDDLLLGFVDQRHQNADTAIDGDNLGACAFGIVMMQQKQALRIVGLIVVGIVFDLDSAAGLIVIERQAIHGGIGGADAGFSSVVA